MSTLTLEPTGATLVPTINTENTPRCVWCDRPITDSGDAIRMDTLDYHAICLDTRQRLLAPLSARADVGDEMEKRVSLCPMCDHCPEVALVGDEIQIGEKGDLVVLKKDEWNVLVEAIKSGRLSKV